MNINININRCGGIFCGNCTSKKAKLPEQGYKEEVRVCDICYRRTLVWKK